jgi:hypothetical protein
MLTRRAISLAIMSFLGLALGSAAAAQTCENPVPDFDALAQRQIVAKIKTAKDYFLTSQDPAAQGSYAQRTARFDSAATVELKSFRDRRRAQYAATVCQYTGSGRTSGRGARLPTTLTVNTGQYLLVETLERTTNGDWKGGPSYSGPAGAPTSLTWVTGGYQPAHTFVRIKAKYADAFIVQRVQQELASVRKELADAGVATQDPTP